MAEEKDLIEEDDDFENLLNKFINSSITDDENDFTTQKPSPEEKKNALSQAEIDENERISQEIDNDLQASLNAAREAAIAEEQQPTLGTEESELAQAFLNYGNSVNRLSLMFLKKPFECQFSIDDLYPNYKPSIGRILSNDLVAGWIILCKIFPNEIGEFPVNSTDEQFLNFAETLKNQDAQLAVISYVEILIDMEGCELTYQTKFLKYREKRIKKIMYEEYLARKERQRRFVEALKAKNFPIDADRLISNYFRVAQKDFDGAYRALTTNPAIFAPIDFKKIKPRFFGLIKVTPNDGIKINIKIGEFLRKLKI